MSTRALYTFTDSDSSWNVYKHHDGYLKGAAIVLNDAAKWFAWQLPRFEADEFAAAFCAAGKAYSMIKAIENNDREGFIKDREIYSRFSQGGGVRFMPQGEPSTVAQKNCSDIEYRYEVTERKGNLHVKAFKVGRFRSGKDKYTEEKKLFEGTLEAFTAFANKEEEEAV